MIRYVRPSEIKKFKRCRRSWALGYVRNLKRVYDEDDEGVARTGTQVHIGLEQHYRGEPVIEPTDALAGIMLEGYFEWLQDTAADAGLTIIYNEARLDQRFGHFHGDEVIITFKPDLVVNDEATGLNLLLDHKTVQSMDQAGQQLKVDDQLLTYTLMLQAAGVPVDGAIHNMLRRVKRTARATPPFYERRIVRFNDTQLANHRKHLIATLGSMVEAAQKLEQDFAWNHHWKAYPNPTKDCTWDCPFLAVCPMLDDGSDFEGFLAAEYQERKVPA